MGTLHTVFVVAKFLMDAHDDLMAVDVDVSLHERHWLREDVEAGTHKVHAEDIVIANNAENALVVVASGLREELDDDSCLRVRLNGSLYS